MSGCRRNHGLLFTAALVFLTPALPSRANQATPGEGQVLLDASVVVEGGSAAGTYKASGVGSCRHIAKPQPIEWTVSYGSGEGSGLRSVQLTVAGLSSGASDQLVLTVIAGKGAAMIATMKGATQAGKGHVTVTTSAKGGVHFSAMGVSEDAATVHVEIECHGSTAQR
jgi:hypothetical protein